MSKPGKSAKKDYSLPTSDELNNLRETQELFKSNLFKLQIDELLKEIRISMDNSRGMQQYLQRLKKLIDSIPEQQVNVPNGRCVLGFELNHGHASCEFTFQPPSRVDLVGSFLLKSIARPVLNVDVALEMPKSCLGAKDYLNYRYLEKRACYLDVVAQFLQSRLVGDLAADLSIAALHDERSRPCLILRPQASSGADAACAGGIDASSSFVIRLFVSVPHDAFPLRKLAPNRNAVRPAHQFGSAIATESVESEQSSWLPTPRYNANVLEDVLFRSHLEQQHAALGSSADKDGVVQAIALFKLWLHLRGLHSAQGRGGLGGFQVSAAALHLIATRRLLPNSMSSYQAFRVLLHFFASHDLNQQPVALPAADQAAPAVDFSTFTAHFPVVLVDSTGLVNLFSRVSLGTYSDVRREASRSLAALDASGGVDGSAVSSVDADRAFEYVFMNKLDFALRFDATLTVDISNFSFPKSRQATIQADDVHRDSVIAEEVQSFLTRAFTDRVKTVSCRGRTLSEWQLCVRSKKQKFNDQSLQAEFRPAETAGTTLLFGLELDESKARRLIDLGPAADDKAAAGVFRAFWGAKSEMRRFKDGSILEAVIWTQPTDDTAVSPFELWAMRDMAAHVLQRHLSISALAMCSSPLEGLILAPNQQALSAMGPCAATAQQRPLHVKGDDVTPTSHLNNVDHTQAFVPLRTAFEKLEKGLRAAPGLPLTIVNLQPVHAAFRHCSVFVPLPVDLGCRECEPLDQLQTLAGAYGVGAEIDESIDINTQVQMRARYSIEPIDVVLQFESSSKWPTDVTAIARIKTAFYLRIAQVMLSEHSLTSAVAEEFVDIFVDGFLFRVRLLHEKEIHLLKQDDSPLASALERTLVHQPQHAIAMKGFQFRFQLFGPTVRLAQRWVASHLFSADLQPACVELLVAHVFAHPLPFAAPSSTLVAFLRFLRVLASYSFSESPLVIDYDGTMSAEQVTKVHAAFAAARQNEKTAASRALWLATPRDPNSLLWTASSPSTLTLDRIAQYARASLNHLTTVVSGDVAQSKAQWLTAFRTPLSLFDAFIVLDERAMCSAHHALFPIRLPVHVAEASDDEDDEDDAPANKKAKLSSSIKPPPASKSRSQAAHDSAVTRAETLAHRQASVPVGLNAADRYVNALRSAFSSVAEFHYDALAPSLIAVKYHTLPEGGNSFSVAQAAFSKPVFGTNGSLSKLEHNLTQLSLEFKRMGAGIVQAVLSSHTEYKQFLASQ